MTEKPRGTRDESGDAGETPMPTPADEDADFADEHTSATFADDLEGGPEGIKEPESPRGHGGDGGMD